MPEGFGAGIDREYRSFTDPEWKSSRDKARKGQQRLRCRCMHRVGSDAATARDWRRACVLVIHGPSVLIGQDKMLVHLDDDV